MINSNLISLKDHFQFAIKSVSNSLSSQNWILKIKKMDHKKIIFNQKYKNKNLKKDSRKASSIENIKPDTSNSRKISIAKRLKIKSVLTKNKIQLKNPFKIQLKQSDKVVFKVTDQNGNMVATLTNRDQAADLLRTNPNYKIEPIATPDPTNMDSVFAIKITKEMLEPYVTHKAMGGLVEDIDIFEVA